MKSQATLRVEGGVQHRVILATLGVVGFAVLTALAAAVKVPLPGTPVPMTLQTVVVLLAGMSLGPWLGTCSMVFYLALGFAGHSVFALQDDMIRDLGLAYLVGPTGGYLLGFVLAQPFTGYLTGGKRPWVESLTATLVGTAVIFACGLTWLGIWLGTGVGDTLAKGLYPFLLPLAIKTGLVIGLGPFVAQRLRRFFGPVADPSA